MLGQGLQSGPYKRNWDGLRAGRSKEGAERVLDASGSASKIAGWPRREAVGVEKKFPTHGIIGLLYGHPLRV